jgi:hypothetical protein
MYESLLVLSRASALWRGHISFDMSAGNLDEEIGAGYVGMAWAWMFWI